MPISWSLLRTQDPTTLAAARSLAHRAVQWATKAARANLEPAPDDSHTALVWDADRAALMTQPLKKGVRVGLRVGILELVFVKGGKVESFAIASGANGEPGRWLDERLAKEGLKPVSGVPLPYETPPTLFGRPSEEAPQLAALANWFAAGAEMLEGVRKRYVKHDPGPSPVRCWPHHFDIAVLVGLEEGDPEHAKSIGIGLSPGDDYYAQPYLYVCPNPKPDAAELPALPCGARWHTRDFLGVVATGSELLAQEDPGQAMDEIIDAAFEESLRMLHAR
jgi:hypothetical protein